MQEILVSHNSFAAPIKAILLGRCSMLYSQSQVIQQYCHNLLRKQSTCEQQRPR
jgi:hypothetical protein